MDPKCTMFIWNSKDLTCFLQMKLEDFKYRFSKNHQLDNYVISKS